MDKTPMVPFIKAAFIFFGLSVAMGIALRSDFAGIVTGVILIAPTISIGLIRTLRANRKAQRESWEKLERGFKKF